MHIDLFALDTHRPTFFHSTHIGILSLEIHVDILSLVDDTSEAADMDLTLLHYTQILYTV